MTVDWFVNPFHHPMWYLLWLTSLNMCVPLSHHHTHLSSSLPSPVSIRTNWCESLFDIFFSLAPSDDGPACAVNHCGILCNDQYNPNVCPHSSTISVPHILLPSHYSNCLSLSWVRQQLSPLHTSHILEEEEDNQWERNSQWVWISGDNRYERERKITQLDGRWRKRRERVSRWMESEEDRWIEWEWKTCTHYGGTLHCCCLLPAHCQLSQLLSPLYRWLLLLLAAALFMIHPGVAHSITMSVPTIIPHTYMNSSVVLQSHLLFPHCFLLVALRDLTNW